MKKNYIRPESRLFAINLDENIAESQTGDETGSTGGILNLGYMLHQDGTGYFNTESYPFNLAVDGGSVQNALIIAVGRYNAAQLLMDCMV